MPLPRHPPRCACRLALAVAGLLLLGAVSPSLVSVAAAAGDRPVMTARALLQGHVRQGSWFAIAVDLENAGPTVDGRAAGQRRRRLQDAVRHPGRAGDRLAQDVPPVRAAAQPSAGNMKVQLVSGDTVVSEAKVAIALHDQTQLVVGRRLREPGEARRRAQAPARASTGAAPTIVAAHPRRPARAHPGLGGPRPARVAGRGRVAASRPAQLAALRTWIAGGGRLVIVGGTAGADASPASRTTCSPTGRTASSTSTRRSCGRSSAASPAGAATLTAYAGEAGAGRVLATSGGRVIAADRKIGSGSRHAAGLRPHDVLARRGRAPGTPRCGGASCRRAPPGGMTLADDSTIVSAVMQPAQPGPAADRRACSSCCSATSSSSAR